jgi:MYXO-CTERM domain-containing protein
VDRIPRTTLILAIILLAMLVALAMLALTRPEEPGPVHTQIVDEMVAVMDGFLNRFSQPGAEGLAPVPWIALLALAVLVGLWLLRRRRADQQHSRSKRS